MENLEVQKYIERVHDIQKYIKYPKYSTYYDV